MISENRYYIGLNPWAVLAPAIMLALLTISVNMTADAYVRSLGRSSGRSRRRKVTPTAPQVVAVNAGTDEIEGGVA
jgi:hypothetical protein